MSGAKRTRSIGRKLSKYGEDEVFALYLKHGSVRKLLKNMPSEVGRMSHGVYYSWLKETAERWSKWQSVMEIRATQYAEEALEIADDADPSNVQVARLQSDTKSVWEAGDGGGYRYPNRGRVPELAERGRTDGTRTGQGS